MATNFKPGANGGIYYATAGTETPGSMTELTNVKDVSLNMQTGESDISSRANSGWRTYASTLRECEVTFQMIAKPNDDGLDAIQAAYLSNGELAFAVLDDKVDGTDPQGPVGDFVVTNFSRSEGLEDAITYDVTLKLSRFVAWNGAS